MQISRLLLLGACGAILTGLTGCGGSGGDTILVGEFASLTGKEATFGISSHEGTALAIEEINAAGGVLGKKLELHHRGRPVQGRRTGQRGEQADLEGRRRRDARRSRLQPLAGSRADLPAERHPDDLARLDESEGDGDRRLHLPRLLHRSLPGHGDGELRHQDAQGEEGRRLHRREERLQQGPREVLQGRLHQGGRHDRRASSTSTAATRISKASSPRSRARRRMPSSCPVTTPTWRSSASRPSSSASTCRSSVATAGRARRW